MSRNVNLITLKKKVETRKMSELPGLGASDWPLTWVAASHWSK